MAILIGENLQKGGRTTWRYDRPIRVVQPPYRDSSPWRVAHHTLARYVGQSRGGASALGDCTMWCDRLTKLLMLGNSLVNETTQEGYQGAYFSTNIEKRENNALKTKDAKMKH